MQTKQHTHSHTEEEQIEERKVEEHESMNSYADQNKTKNPLSSMEGQKDKKRRKEEKDPLTLP